MKKLLLPLILVAGFAKVIGQPSTKFISEKRVSKIITTLASDEMHGRSALKPEDINKAGSFIAKEFKKAGLKQMDGITDYIQEFQKRKLELVNLEVAMNGVAVPKDRMVLSSKALEVSMDENTPIDTIGKSQSLFDAIFTFERQNVDKIVFIAEEHAEEFQRAKRYLGRAKILDLDFSPGSSTLYILGKPSGPVTAKATQENKIIAMANVVGQLPGISRPNEYVVFSAHYDHIGIQPAVDGDSIANGADDDASGTTAVITLANYFKKLKSNDRTLIFIAFTAEEIGGFGSKYFSQQLNADQVVAMFNIEMIGKPSKWGQNAAFMTGFERSDLGEIMQENLEGTPFHMYPDPYPEQNLFYRSDNATLARLGVPAHSISTDQIPTDAYYHTVDDEISTLDMANITATIRAIALGSKSIVEGNDTPTRVDKSKVN